MEEIGQARFYIDNLDNAGTGIDHSSAVDPGGIVLALKDSPLRKRVFIKNPKDNGLVEIGKDLSSLTVDGESTFLSKSTYGDASGSSTTIEITPQKITAKHFNTSDAGVVVDGGTNGVSPNIDVFYKSGNTDCGHAIIQTGTSDASATGLFLFSDKDKQANTVSITANGAAYIKGDIHTDTSVGVGDASDNVTVTPGGVKISANGNAVVEMSSADGINAGGTNITTTATVTGQLVHGTSGLYAGDSQGTYTYISPTQVRVTSTLYTDPSIHLDGNSGSVKAKQLIAGSFTPADNNPMVAVGGSGFASSMKQYEVATRNIRAVGNSTVGDPGISLEYSSSTRFSVGNDGVIFCGEDLHVDEHSHAAVPVAQRAGVYLCVARILKEGAEKCVNSAVLYIFGNHPATVDTHFKWGDGGGMYDEIVTIRYAYGNSSYIYIDTASAVYTYELVSVKKIMSF